MMKRVFNFVVLGWISIQCAIVTACPMCKDSISDPANGPTGHASSLPAGFNNSIYVMLAGLLLTMGFVGMGLVKAIRGADRSNMSQFAGKDSTQNEE